jgi:nucleoside-diphosphate-sugar epimerase
MAQTSERVLVTGGSGFIGGHCILRLLEQGFEVRTTVRSLDREAAVRAVLSDAGMKNGDSLTFVAADLMSDAGWAAAVAGCDFVLHVASPVHVERVDNEDEVIRPAIEGTLRVLSAARDAGVKRVVLTSAFHAVAWGHPHDGHVFTEEDWSDLDGPGVTPYTKSKTLAEAAAWDFVRAEGGSLELVTLLPVAVMGPLMGAEISGSNNIVRRMLSGGMPAFPDVWIPIVDVRDVAIAHVLAMTTPDAAGERFLVSAGPAIPMKRIGAILTSALGASASKVPTRSIPALVMRAAAIFTPEFRPILPDLGYARKMTSAKAARILGWTARTPEDAVVATGESMIAKGLISA